MDSRKAICKPITMQKYAQTERRLREYENEYGTLTFESIDLDFYPRFVGYLKAQGNATNTWSKRITNLRTFMEYCTAQDWNTNLKFRTFKSPKVQGMHIALTAEDLGKIQAASLDSERLEKVRDLFLFQCAVGMRVSDLKNLNPDSVKGGRLTFFQKKGAENRSEPVRLTLHPDTLAIWDKYSGRLPVISEQKYRDYIKEICQIAGLTEPVYTRNGPVPKYKVVLTHTARRTCATMLYSAGVHINTIRIILGHSNISQTQKYIKASTTDYQDALLEI